MNKSMIQVQSPARIPYGKFARNHLAQGLLAGASLLATVLALPAKEPADSDKDEGAHRKVEHVLLVSVDGLHQADLAWYVQTHPESTLATLMAGGVDYSDASTPFPSDSFPGMVGQITGGNPATTGIYHDDT